MSTEANVSDQTRFAVQPQDRPISNQTRPRATNAVPGPEILGARTDVTIKKFRAIARHARDDTRGKVAESANDITKIDAAESAPSSADTARGGALFARNSNSLEHDQLFTGKKFRASGRREAGGGIGQGVPPSCMGGAGRSNRLDDYFSFRCFHAFTEISRPGVPLTELPSAAVAGDVLYDGPRGSCAGLTQADRRTPSAWQRLPGAPFHLVPA
jgi:hypothetical protein